MIPSESQRCDQTECAMHKKYIVRLSDADRAQWTELTRKGPAAASKIRHAPILLKADADGPAWADTKIAERCSVSVNTVLGVRPRWVEQGLEAALNRKQQTRPSRTPRWDGEAEARLIALRCGEPPAGHARWTLRLLADQAVVWDIVEAISYEPVSQALKKTRGHRSCGRWGSCRPSRVGRLGRIGKLSWSSIRRRTSPRSPWSAWRHNPCR
jgi:homeodomain-containing protein